MGWDVQRAVFQLTVDSGYGFWDDPEWGIDINKEDCLAILSVNSEVGYHSCERSAVYDDMTDYVDELQDEENLPNERFLVTYYWWDGRNLIQLADVDISREEIIQNVLNQKYREGADYFLMREVFK